MQVHNVRVETVSGMSTRVDSDSLYSASAVETVKKMSTKVDPEKSSLVFLLKL